MTDEIIKRDFSSSNAMVVLVENRERVKQEIADKQKEFAEINDAIKELMDDAGIGTIPGWQIRWLTHHRKEYTVRAMDIKSLTIRRVGIEGDDHEEEF